MDSPYIAPFYPARAPGGRADNANRRRIDAWMGRRRRFDVGLSLSVDFLGFQFHCSAGLGRGRYAMTSTIYNATDRFDIGKTFGQTSSVLKENFLAFLLMAALLGGLPQLIGGLCSALGKGNIALTLVAAVFQLAGFVTVFIMYGALIHGSVQSLNGTPATVRECIDAGGARWLALLASGFLMTVCVSVGLMLFLVPGVLLALRWSVTWPAMLIESRGIGDGMSRSVSLTKGRRGSLFLCFLVFAIIVLVLEMVIFAVAGGFSFMRGRISDPLAISSEAAIFAALATPLINIVIGMIGSAFVAAVYQQLRVGREGVPSEHLAEVFA